MGGVDFPLIGFTTLFLFAVWAIGRAFQSCKLPVILYAETKAAQRRRASARSSASSPPAHASGCSKPLNQSAGRPYRALAWFSTYRRSSATFSLGC